MVRYKTPLHQSDTVRGVCEALAGSPSLCEGCQFLIWDNSPEKLTNPVLPIPFEYRYSLHNLGISGAGNYAMQLAREQGQSWMLLLDQDTCVSAPFLKTMLRWSHDLAREREIALVAPTVRSGELVVSPGQYLFNRHCAYPDSVPGIAIGEAFAISSGSLIRVAALRKIGGFSNNFWLDCSDMDVCHRLYLHGYKVWRATDAELQHEMTVLDDDRLMTPARYINYLYAESAFNDLYKGFFENCSQDLRLFARAIRQRREYQNQAFSRITFAQLRYRLRVSRRVRIERWLEVGEQRRATMTLNDAIGQRRAVG